MLVHNREKLKVKEREFIIDPWNDEPKETICSYLREIWRIGDTMKNEQIKDLAAAAYDKANRMSRGLIDHRRHLLKLPEEYREVEKGNCSSYE